MAIGNTGREKKPLSVTIGPEFGKVGGKGLPGTDLQSQIVRLTGAAEQYLKRGQSALAFDSLMEAYLLDPLNPLVLSCEKNVLPAWEAFRTKQRGMSPGVRKSVKYGNRHQVHRGCCPRNLVLIHLNRANRLFEVFSWCSCIARRVHPGRGSPAVLFPDRNGHRFCFRRSSPRRPRAHRGHHSWNHHRLCRPVCSPRRRRNPRRRFQHDRLQAGHLHRVRDGQHRA